MVLSIATILSLPTFLLLFLVFIPSIECSDNKKKQTVITTKELQCESLQAEIFSAPSIDFQGNTLANAALTNTTIHGSLQHLSVHTLGVESEARPHDPASGRRMAVIDARGSVSTINEVKWNDGSLQVPALSAPSNQLTIDANVDFASNTLSNFQIKEGTNLSRLSLKQATISNSILENVTFAEDLTLGSIVVDDITLVNKAAPTASRSRSSKDMTEYGYDHGGQAHYLLMVDIDGKVHADNSGGPLLTFHSNAEASMDLKDSEAGGNDDEAQLKTKPSIVVHGASKFKNTVDFAGNRVRNMRIVSGHIDGQDIDISARNIRVGADASLTLSRYKESKRHMYDALTMVDVDGTIQSTNVTIEDGWMEHAKFKGEVVFQSESSILLDDVRVQGGSMSIQDLEVQGRTVCKGELEVHGETYIDGSITVSGSVLGSGPYVDVSDGRLKTNVEAISRVNLVEKLGQLQAVSYKLNAEYHKSRKNTRSSSHPLEPAEELNRKEIGFIAQDVKKHFPELVTSRPDGFLGVQYARFVPLILEAIKDLNERLDAVEEENAAFREILQRFTI